MLANYTSEHIQKIKDSLKGLDGAKTLMRRFGGEIKEFYLCLGAHDIVVVAEAPDDETPARFVVAVASLSFVRTTTLKAFPEQDFLGIIDTLP